MARRKKLINNTNIPQHEIEKIARILFPDIQAYYESEEGPSGKFSRMERRRREQEKTKDGECR
jgi:hypothetical protein